MKENVKLDTGSHYWWRQKFERIWRVCYIAEDSDENQWMYPIDIPPMKVEDLTLDCFDWQKIDEPSDKFSIPDTKKEVINQKSKSLEGNRKTPRKCSTPLCGGIPSWVRKNALSSKKEYKCFICFQRNKHHLRGEWKRIDANSEVLNSEMNK